MMRWMAIVAAALVPSVVSAQESAPGWPGLDPSKLSTVYVTDETGAETSGRLIRLDPGALVLLVDGAERRFEAARVRRIDRRGDSLRNGALIGAVAGVVMGLVSGGISDCPGDDPGGDCPGTRAAIVIFSTGVYTALGTAIDALIPGRTALYVAPGPSQPAVRPTRSQETRAGIVLSFTW